MTADRSASACVPRAAFDVLRLALADLLAAPDLHMESLDPETVERIDAAEVALAFVPFEPPPLTFDRARLAAVALIDKRTAEHNATLARLERVPESAWDRDEEEAQNIAETARDELRAVRAVLDPTPPRDRAATIAAAIAHLQAARDLLREAGAPKAAGSARRAIKSAAGAHRHAQLEPIRAERQAADAAASVGA